MTMRERRRWSRPRMPAGRHSSQGRPPCSTERQGGHMNRKRIAGVLVALGLLTAIAAACGTVGGAAVGAGAGAAIGAGTGYGAGKGALIGTGVGAAAGTIYDATRK